MVLWLINNYYPFGVTKNQWQDDSAALSSR